MLPSRGYVNRHDCLIEVDHLSALEVAAQIIEVPSSRRLSAFDVR